MKIGVTSRHSDEGRRFHDFRNLKLVERDFANHGPDNRNERSAALRPLKEVAEEAIDRALTNAILLGIPRPAEAKRFRDWVLQHVVGFPSCYKTEPAG
jgi:hypothetical protein